MAQYPKTTGALVTVNIRNANKAGGDGRMKLDAQLIEMMDILHPVGEVKFMMTDQVDPWIEKMAVYNQVWARGDGSLVKVADYPRIFNDIGFKYGWSNTNPNGTYTYTFTDNNGSEKSIVIYEDLDIDGNAKPVPEGESPLYFRLPNLSGRFLRCAGTASYVNKWTDTDGTVRQLLTEYKAEMYKGQLDAQRGITGEMQARAMASDVYGCLPVVDNCAGVFHEAGEIGITGAYLIGATTRGAYSKFMLASSYKAPVSPENMAIAMAIQPLVRISWGITGWCDFILGGANSSDERSGPFQDSRKMEGYVVRGDALGSWDIHFDSSYVAPVMEESTTISVCVASLLRIKWGISGYKTEVMIFSGKSNEMVDSSGTGPFYPADGRWNVSMGSTTYVINRAVLHFNSSRAVPTAKVSTPAFSSIAGLMRLRWGIYGKLHNNFNCFTILGAYGDKEELRNLNLGCYKTDRVATTVSEGGVLHLLGTRFGSSYQVPTAGENHPLSIATSALIRVRWGISGNVGTVINFGMDKLFYPKKAAEPWKISSGGGLGVVIPALDISRAVPTSYEISPTTLVAACLLRIRWGISGSTTLSLYGEYSVGSKNEGALTTALGESKRNDGAWRDDGVKLKFTSSKVAPTSEEVSSIGAIVQTLIRIAWGISGEMQARAMVSDVYGCLPVVDKCAGAFHEAGEIGITGAYLLGAATRGAYSKIIFASSYKAPVSIENKVVSTATQLLVRIAWGISGQLANIASPANPYDTQNGVFRKISYTGKWDIKWDVPSGGSQFFLIMNSSLVVPPATEDRPISHSTSCLFRIRWGISGVLDASYNGGASGFHLLTFASGCMQMGNPQLAPNLAELQTHKDIKSAVVKFRSSYQIATSKEVVPVGNTLLALIRIAWGINGGMRPNGDFSGSAYTPSGLTGAFQAGNQTDKYLTASPLGEGWVNVVFDAGNVVPISNESSPTALVVMCMLRIHWGISGRITGPDPYGAVTVNSIRPAGGVFKLVFTEGNGSSISQSNRTANIYLDSSYRIPDSTEAHPVMINTTCLLRIRWGIRGLLHETLFWAPFEGGEGAFFRTAPYKGYFSGIGDGSFKFIPREVLFDTSGSIPITTENLPLQITVEALLRTRWGITGGVRVSSGHQYFYAMGIGFGKDSYRALHASPKEGNHIAPRSAPSEAAKDSTAQFNLNASYEIPVARVNTPVAMSVSVLLRISWADIA